MLFKLSPGWLGPVFVILFVTKYCGADGSEECECSITVMGPLRDQAVVFVCNAYTPEGVNYQNLDYTWLLTNTSHPSPEKTTTQLYHDNQPKLVIWSPASGDYTCLVSGPGIAAPLTCSVSLNQSVPGIDHREWPLEVRPHCVDQRAPVFKPTPEKGLALLDPRGRPSLTCTAPLLRRSQTGTKFTMELLPLENYHPQNVTEPISLDAVTTNPTTTDSGLSSLNVKSTKSPKWMKEKCDFDHDYRDHEITIEFARASRGCLGVYMCSVGVGSLLRSSTLVVFRKSASHRSTGTHSRHHTIRGKSKRDLSPLLDDDDKGNTSHHADDDEDGDDHHPHEQAEKNTIDVVWLSIGVVFMVLLTGVAVACAVVWRKKMLRHHSRYLARVTSSSKAPLFINKAFTKSESNELEEFPRKHIRFLDHIGKGTFGTVVMAETFNLQKQKKGSSSKRWQVVAIKMTLISEKTNEQLKKDFLSEVTLMKSIPVHPNIITLFASCTAHDPYLMILEYAKHGDLRKYLLNHRTERNYANAAYLAYGVDSRRTSNYYSTTCGQQPGDNKNKYEKITTDPKKYNNVPTSESELITSRDVLSFALQICRGLDHLTQNKIVHRDVAARNVLVCEHKVVKISDFGLARKVGEQDVYERTTK
ncbi:unnamed protein product, partial [Candidula unifasciata]